MIDLYFINKFWVQMTHPKFVRQLIEDLTAVNRGLCQSRGGHPISRGGELGYVKPANHRAAQGRE